MTHFDRHPLPCGIAPRPFKRLTAGVAAFALCLFIIGFPILPTWSDESASEATPSVEEVPTPFTLELLITENDIDEKRNAIIAERDALAQAAPPEVGAATEELIAQTQRQLELYDQILMTLDRQLNAVRQGITLLETRSNAAQALAEIRTSGPTDPRPWRLPFMDSLQSELASMTERSAALNDAIRVADQTMEQARRQRQDRENALAQATQALEQNQDPTLTPQLNARMQTAQVELKLAQENELHRQIERRNQHRANEAHEAQIALLRERIAHINRELVFYEQHLLEQIERLEAEEKHLENQRRIAENNRYTANEFHRAATERLAALKADPNATVDPVLEEEVTARLFEIMAYQEEIAAIDKMRGRIPDRRETWQRRFRVFNANASMEELHEWMEQTQRLIQNLEIENRLEVSELTNLVRNHLILDAKLETHRENPRALERVQDQKRFLEHRIQQGRANILNIETTLRLLRKLLEEIEAQTETWSWRDYIAYGALLFNHYLDRPLTTWSEGEGFERVTHTLTYRQVFFALLYFVIGLIVARYFSRVLVRFLLSRLGVHEGASAALQALTFYILALIVFVYTLNAVRIDLTAFAFLGGALAIGVGFGSQNLINNFISGLILLSERPVRQGDYIEVDGVYGEVMRIGARCTHVRTFDNIDLMLPNSKLLENKVVNMTLSDQVVRRRLRVGVAYGSNSREVTKLVLKAVEEHGVVLKKPEPYVVFSELSDTAMIFDAYYWFLMHPQGNGLILDSDIRHRIMNLFNEHGIMIAYPQRDIHIDTRAPLQIRMLDDKPSSEEGDQ